jgi:hypothetical protein
MNECSTPSAVYGHRVSVCAGVLLHGAKRLVVTASLDGVVRLNPVASVTHTAVAATILSATLTACLGPFTFMRQVKNALRR